jgi:hypothetical protein
VDSSEKDKQLAIEALGVSKRLFELEHRDKIEIRKATKFVMKHIGTEVTRDKKGRKIIDKVEHVIRGIDKDGQPYEQIETTMEERKNKISLEILEISIDAYPDAFYVVMYDYIFPPRLANLATNGYVNLKAAIASLQTFYECKDGDRTDPNDVIQAAFKIKQLFTDAVTDMLIVEKTIQSAMKQDLATTTITAIKYGFGLTDKTLNAPIRKQESADENALDAKQAKEEKEDSEKEKDEDDLLDAESADEYT